VPVEELLARRVALIPVRLVPVVRHHTRSDPVLNSEWVSK
jgi:hypothetical protein